MWIRPSVEDFKNYFSRDFPYNSDPNLGVTDIDIQKAMGEAEFNVNDRLASTQEAFNTLFLLLTAHYLVMDLRASDQGVNGNYSWMTSSKGVGSVSESYAIPSAIMDDPVLSMFGKTFYGAKYINLTFGQTIGVMFTVGGRTLP